MADLAAIHADPLGLLVAFGAGMLSFLSPCVLPLVPAYLSMVSGLSAAELSALRPVPRPTPSDASAEAPANAPAAAPAITSLSDRRPTGSGGGAPGPGTGMAPEAGRSRPVGFRRHRAGHG